VGDCFTPVSRVRNDVSRLPAGRQAMVKNTEPSRMLLAPVAFLRTIDGGRVELFHAEEG